LHAEATKATEPGVGADIRRRRLGDLRSSLPALLVLIMSLAATAITWYVLRSQVEANGATDFEDDTRQLAQTIGVGMQGYEETLHAVGALFATTRVVTRDDWRRFVDGLELGRDHPGIEILGFAKQLHAQQRELHEREMQAQGLPDYRIWPDRIRDDAVAVTFIEPFGAEARRSLGYDLMADPVSRRAVEAAHASAGVSLSGPWAPAAARNRGPAHKAATILMVEALYQYQSESAPADATKRGDPVGYVYAALDCDQLMADLLHESVVDVGFAVYDGARTSGGALLYANTRARDILRAGRKSEFESNIPLTVAGHRWMLRFLSGPYEQAVPHRPLQWIVLAAGIPLSLLLFGIAWSQATLRARASRIAVDMTKSVREQAGLLDLTHDTVFLRDHSNIIRYWNRAASDTYGYSAEEAVGRTGLAFPRPSRRSGASSRKRASGRESSFRHAATAARSSPPRAGRYRGMRTAGSSRFSKPITTSRNIVGSSGNAAGSRPACCRRASSKRWGRSPAASRTTSTISSVRSLAMASWQRAKRHRAARCAATSTTSWSRGSVRSR
jgi:PAS domain S-box-containing protein